MKKLLAYILLSAIALSLCSCAGTGESEPAEPQSIPDVESIVEPVSEDEPSSEASSESEPVSEPETAVSDFPEEPQIPEAEPPKPVADEFTPPAISEAQADAVVEASEPELHKAVASDFRLDSEAIESELFRLINSLRDDEGVSALGIEDSMRLAARVRAEEALESFSHTRPNETPYNTAFDEAGFSYAGKWHGENLSSISCSTGGLTEKEIALMMFNGLKGSPGHYRNMTEINFVQTGIGVAVSYTGGNIDIASAQMFSSL